MFIKMQKISGLATHPCFTPRVKGMCAVSPMLLEEEKVELEMRSLSRSRSGIPSNSNVLRMHGISALLNALW